MNEENNNESELNEVLKDMWSSLTDEQKEKAKECRSIDELMALAGQLGVELPDDMLDAVAGGEIVRLNNGRYRVYGVRMGGRAWRPGHLATMDDQNNMDYGPINVTCDTLEQAIQFARDHHLNSNIISEAEYNKQQNGGC